MGANRPEADIAKRLVMAGRPFQKSIVSENGWQLGKADR